MTLIIRDTLLNPSVTSSALQSHNNVCVCVCRRGRGGSSISTIVLCTERFGEIRYEGESMYINNSAWRMAQSFRMHSRRNYANDADCSRAEIGWSRPISFRREYRRSRLGVLKTMRTARKFIHFQVQYCCWAPKRRDSTVYPRLLIVCFVDYCAQAQNFENRFLVFIRLGKVIFRLFADVAQDSTF